MPPNDLLAEIRASPDEALPVLTRARRVVEKYASGRGELVDDALGDTVWGAIRWNRDLGSPAAPRMSDGFSVRFQYKEVHIVMSRAGPITTYKWKEGARPILWDGPHDDENFRVGFLHHGRREWTQDILVELKSDIEWQGMKPWWISPGRRILYPQTSIDGDGTFGLNPVGPTFIDDFVVTNLFY